VERQVLVDQKVYHLWRKNPQGILEPGQWLPADRKVEPRTPEQIAEERKEIEDRRFRRAMEETSAFLESIRNGLPADPGRG